jgi:hypothetical protein
VEEVEIVNDHGHYDGKACSDLRGVVGQIVILEEATHREDAIRDCGGAAAAGALVLLDAHQVEGVAAYDGTCSYVLVAAADT